MANLALLMGNGRIVIKRLRFPLDIMLLCVRWYVAYPLSLRNLEEMMPKRGVFYDPQQTLEPLAESSGNMRGHKVQVYAIWQKRSQIEECYGETESVTDNLGRQKYYAMPPGDEAEWLSTGCGSTTKTIKHGNASGKRFEPGPMGRHAARVFPLDERVAADGLSRVQRDFLRSAIAEKRNIIVSGEQNAGKATFCNSLLNDAARR